MTVKAENYATGVFLTFPNHDGWFEDNYFDLLPGELKQVRFVPETSSPVDFTTETLQAISLWNVWPGEAAANP